MSESKTFNENFETLFDRPVVLYGAGITGVEVQKVLTRRLAGVRLSCFCDRYKTGHMNGLPIISPQALKQLCEHEHPLIIVTGMAASVEAIASDLRTMGVDERLILLMPDLVRLLTEHLGDARIDDWYRTIVRAKASLPRDEALYLDWWCPEHYCPGDILVYQPGKVGSSTICNSLAAHGVSVTHVHMLTDAFICDLIPEMAWTPTAGDLQSIRAVSQYCIRGIKSSGPLKIITLVREPISRDFSHFMYHLSELIRCGVLRNKSSILKACQDGILKRATMNGKCRYGYQFEWFNKELHDVFGVNVYAHPFDYEMGYSIVRQGNVEILLIKLERLDELEHVIGDFVGVSDFRLKNANVSSEKLYRDLYRELKETVEVPYDVFSLYYDGNPLVDHFYDKHEQGRFLAKWRYAPADYSRRASKLT